VGGQKVLPWAVLKLYHSRYSAKHLNWAKGGKLHPPCKAWRPQGVQGDYAYHAIPQMKGTYIIASSGSATNPVSALN